MDLVELREMQAPLKARYREDPGSAVTPVHAQASLDSPGVSVEVGSWAGPVRAGLHLATGGDGADACSGDMLMEALVACAGVTLRSVALAMQLDVRGGSLRASGTFDASGTLGVAKDVPVGCSDIVIHAELDTDASADQLERLGQLTERYCVVGQSLRAPVKFTVERVSRST